ncbi:hypothetical protein C3L33_20781, partial [Rhododendron williamsianum]
MRQYGQLLLVPLCNRLCKLVFFFCQITLTGFMFLVTSALLGYVSGIYSPHLDSAPPRWVHFMHGLLLFLYQVSVNSCKAEQPSAIMSFSYFVAALMCYVCQTFDAVDGKQARRTFSSSPLGELFDHGCDALACAVCTSIEVVIPYPCQVYFTNTLILPAVNGPTEGLMLIYLCHFFTAIVGAEWWAQHFGKSFPFLSWVPFFNGFRHFPNVSTVSYNGIVKIPTYEAALFLMISSAVIPTISFKTMNSDDEFPLHGVMLYCSVYNVYKVVQGRKGSMLLALAMLYPFVVLLGGVLLWYVIVYALGFFSFLAFEVSFQTGSYLFCRDYLSPNDLMGTYPHLVILGTGLAFGFLVSLLFLPLGIANALTARLNDGIPLVDEQWVLLAYCIYTVTLYLHFATSVIHEITTALGICCFRITRKEA